MFVEYGELSTKMYELTKPVGSSLNGDLEYYYQHLRSTAGKILEAGVGTGRLMIPLLQKGLQVEGVDLSEPMLAQARENMAQAQVNEILRSYYQHLETGGQLLLDLELPSWFTEKETIIEEYPLTADSGILFTSTAQTMDWHRQQTAYIHRYDLVRNGRVAQSEVSHFVLYWYGIEEFSLLLQNTGFSDVRWEAGYGKDPRASLITFFAVK